MEDPSYFVSFENSTELILNYVLLGWLFYLCFLFRGVLLPWWLLLRWLLLWWLLLRWLSRRALFFLFGRRLFLRWRFLFWEYLVRSFNCFQNRMGIWDTSIQLDDQVLILQSIHILQRIFVRQWGYIRDLFLRPLWTANRAEAFNPVDTDFVWTTITCQLWRWALDFIHSHVIVPHGCLPLLLSLLTTSVSTPSQVAQAPDVIVTLFFRLLPSVEFLLLSLRIIFIEDRYTVWGVLWVDEGIELQVSVPCCWGPLLFLPWALHRGLVQRVVQRLVQALVSRFVLVVQPLFAVLRFVVLIVVSRGDGSKVRSSIPTGLNLVLKIRIQLRVCFYWLWGNCWVWRVLPKFVQGIQTLVSCSVRNACVWMRGENWVKHQRSF